MISARQFPKVYENLDIDLNELGCVMLDVSPRDIPAFPEKYNDKLYYAQDVAFFWLDGFVGKKPHLTLLYGLTKPAIKLQEEIGMVLKDWELPLVTIDDIGFFESPVKDHEPYYTIVAHIEPDEHLLEGHQRLSLLPHINTFPTYRPHITIAYVQRDAYVRDQVINHYRELVGQRVKTTAINLGEH